jgi:predicted transposase/invertase (TIGR01784 family)
MADINPKVDIAFKKIFGVEENKDLLISLINSIVSAQDQVKDITLLNPYNPQNFKSDKLSILDVKAIGHNGKRFNIEIQISDEADYDKRALYYWAKLYTEQLKAGQDYSKLSKAIGIHILNFTSIPNGEKYHNVFHIKEKDTDLLYFKDLELHTIELTKFSSNEDEKLEDIVCKVKTALDMWLAFLTRHELLERDKLPARLNDANLQKALDVLNIMNFSYEEKEAYEDHLKWLRIEANTLHKYEQKGREEGRIEGRKEGRVEGETKKAIEMALVMLNENEPIAKIIKYTNLTTQEIELLKK